MINKESKYLTLEYWRQYNNIIEDNVSKYISFILSSDTIEESNSKYSEKHHVIPHSIDDSIPYDDIVIRLLLKDHYIAHKMLVDCFSDIRTQGKMASSVIYMRTRKDNSLIEDSPEEYERIRKIFIDSISGDNNYTHAEGFVSHTKGMHWYTNGTDSIMTTDDNVPDGYYLGMGFERHGDKNYSTGTSYMNNGIEERRVKKELIDEYLSNGYVLGKLHKGKKHYYTNGTIDIQVEEGKEVPERFYKGRTHSNKGSK